MIVNISIFPTMQHLSVELEPETIIEDLKEFLFEYCNLKFKKNGWSCYSQIRKCLLQPYQQLGNYHQDTIIFYFDESSESQEKQESSESSVIINLDDSLKLETNKSVNLHQSSSYIIFSNYQENIMSTQSIIKPLDDSIQHNMNEKIEDSNLEDKKNNYIIHIIVHFYSLMFALDLDQNSKIQEIFDELFYHYNQKHKNLNINDRINQLVCHSQKRNCYLKFDEIVGNYPNDVLTFKNLQDLNQSSVIQSDYIFLKQLLSIYVKVDQRNLEVMEINKNTQIKDILSSIKNKYKIQENYDKWRCYSEARKCYLNIQQQFGDYPNDQLIISTEYELQQYQILQRIKQMKNEIKDKIKYIKTSILKDLNQIEKQMTNCLKTQKETILKLFSENTLVTTQKLREYILEKKKENIKIYRNTLQLQEITQKWRNEFNQIGCQKKVENQEVNLLINKQTSGIELLQYLKDYFSNLQVKNKTGIDLQCYSVKYEKIIDLENQLLLEVQQDDTIVIGNFLVIFRQSDENDFDLNVQKLQ
ncbi:unnamed protein product [Paramecium pentaurelia]|uniref:Uncharacterized protein n=1 Tax=Paramecium pentaurelia TaxID=43138 RepID=A0A8S1V781_9CILI|nr:unnamed protein product [Paramecium pentaurelia]